jgi:heterogeneous nuclear rnp K-like protein 2
MPSDSPNHARASCTPPFPAHLSYSLIDLLLASPQGSRSPSPSGRDVLTLRALVSTRDAGVIIGKGGKNVADLREQTGVKAGVSRVVTGIHERVLSISGSVESVAKVCLCFSMRVYLSPDFPSLKAYALIIAQLVDANPSSPHSLHLFCRHTSMRLLISHNLMGTIIGRSGLKIKAIQDGSGARMVASKEILPQSTERVVDVQGSPEAIGRAIEEIGRCLLEDWERGLGTVLYDPGVADERSSGRRSHGHQSNYNGKRGNGDSNARAPSPPSPTTGNPANLRTQNISIPSDMVGCIIGRGGTKITEIRRLSGSKISIAKAPHDETGERMFTIVGTPEANEKALFLLYNQLESEKERRVGKEQSQEEDPQD